MDFIIKYYETSMPPTLVPRLGLDDFSSCGSLTKPVFKTQNTVVLFYVPECRFCQTFSNELSKFYRLYGKDTNTSVAAMDVSLVENFPIVKKSEHFPYKLGNEWPLIMIYQQGKPCSSYKSTREAVALKDFIIKNIGIGKSCEFKYVPCD